MFEEEDIFDWWEDRREELEVMVDTVVSTHYKQIRRYIVRTMLERQMDDPTEQEIADSVATLILAVYKHLSETYGPWKVLTVETEPETPTSVTLGGDYTSEGDTSPEQENNEEKQTAEQQTEQILLPSADNGEPEAVREGHATKDDNHPQQERETKAQRMVWDDGSEPGSGHNQSSDVICGNRRRKRNLRSRRRRVRNRNRDSSRLLDGNSTHQTRRALRNPGRERHLGRNKRRRQRKTR